MIDYAGSLINCIDAKEVLLGRLHSFPLIHSFSTLNASSVGMHLNNHLKIEMSSSRKDPYPPHEGHWKCLGGGGGEVLGVKILEAKYEAKLEFP